MQVVNQLERFLRGKTIRQTDEGDLVREPQPVVVPAALANPPQVRRGELSQVQYPVPGRASRVHFVLPARSKTPVYFHAYRGSKRLDYLPHAAENTCRTGVLATEGMAMATIAYLRVSKDTQDVKNQRLAILEFARHEKLEVDDFMEIIVSSRRSAKERKMDVLLERLASSDILVVSELSRMGRSVEKSSRRWTH